MNPSNQMDWRRPDPDVHDAAVAAVEVGAVAGGTPAVPVRGMPVHAEVAVGNAAAGAGTRHVGRTAEPVGTELLQDKPGAVRNHAQEADGRPEGRTGQPGEHAVRRAARVCGSAARRISAVWHMLGGSCVHVL